MATCTFCKETFTGKGTIYVLKTGKMYKFCSSKCRKNMLNLGREPRNIDWVRKKKKEEKR